MNKLLKIKFAWFPVWSIVLLMMTMISIYLPVFSGSTQKLTDFPLIIVSEDKAFASSDTGKKILSNLTTQQDGHSFNWMVDLTREDAIKDIKADKAYGALIIPADFSTTTTALHQSLVSGNKDGKAAHLEILLNDGGGQMATGVSTQVLNGVAQSISDGVSGQFTAELIKKDMQVSPQAASLLDTPIQFYNH